MVQKRHGTLSWEDLSLCFICTCRLAGFRWRSAAGSSFPTGQMFFANLSGLNTMWTLVDSIPLWLSELSMNHWSLSDAMHHFMQSIIFICCPPSAIPRSLASYLVRFANDWRPCTTCFKMAWCLIPIRPHSQDMGCCNQLHNILILF